MPNEKEIRLILLPGMDGTGVLFEPLIERLPGYVRPTTVSYPPTGPNGYADLSPIVERALPKREPFVLLGWSFSGPLAVKAASRHPEGLRGVILCASFIRNPTLFPPSARVLARPAVLDLIPFFMQAKMLLGGYATLEARDALVRAHEQVSPSAFAERIRSILAVDVEAEFRRCSSPLLYLAASRDWVVPTSNHRSMRRINSSMKLAEIEGPHLALLTNPKAAVREIENFVGRLG